MRIMNKFIIFNKNIMLSFTSKKEAVVERINQKKQKESS